MRYYSDSATALAILRNLPGGSPLLSASRFSGMTPAEFDQALRELEEELALQVCMTLFASYEAVLKEDCHIRVERRFKDVASKRFRKMAKGSSKGRLGLESILDAWKALTGNAKVIGEFKQMMKFRHWLAHGRYWSQKSGLVDPTPQQLYERGQSLFAVLESSGFPTQ